MTTFYSNILVFWIKGSVQLTDYFCSNTSFHPCRWWGSFLEAGWLKASLPSSGVLKSYPCYSVSQELIILMSLVGTHTARPGNSVHCLLISYQTLFLWVFSDTELWGKGNLKWESQWRSFVEHVSYVSGLCVDSAWEWTVHLLSTNTGFLIDLFFFFLQDEKELILFSLFCCFFVWLVLVFFMCDKFISIHFSLSFARLSYLQTLISYSLASVFS